MATPALSSLLPVGLLGRPHGVRGELHLRLFAEAQAWAPTKWKSAWVESTNALRELPVRAARSSGQSWLIMFAGIESRDAATELANARVLVLRSALPPLAEGEFYVADTVGLSVQDQRGASLGRVTSTFWNGAQDVAVVTRAEAEELLLPLVGAVVKRVDLAAGLMTVEWEVEEDGLGGELGRTNDG